MSDPKLATYVHVADKSGKMHVFGPDDEVPDWAVRKITNPRAWEGGEAPVAEEPTAKVERLRAELAAAEVEADDAAKEDDHAGDGEAGPYAGKKADELRAELAKRELPTSGTKPELIERLLADEARKSEPTQ